MILVKSEALAYGFKNMLVLKFFLVLYCIFANILIKLMKKIGKMCH